MDGAMTDGAMTDGAVTEEAATEGPVPRAEATAGGDGRAWPAATIDESVRAWAAERPDDPALIGPRATMTWVQLDLAAGRAAGIIAETHGPGARVAWLGRNDIGYAVTLLGTWRTRGALVGLNWRQPEADLADACRHVGVTHVFTSEEFADRAQRITGTGVHVEVIDQTTSSPWPGRAAVPPSEPGPEDMALVFFTSGSTGAPKAVPTDRLSVEIGASTPTVHRFDSRSKLLIVPPVFHLAGAYWAQYGLLYGAQQVYLDDADPGAIVDSLVRRGITHAVFVPTLVRAIVDELTVQPRELPEFRHLAYGASSITVPLLREAIEVLGCEFCQVYGMSEAGGVVTYLPPEDHMVHGAHVNRLSSAGKPTAGVYVQVRDPFTREPMPTGETGELWFATPFMARGYLGDPDRSAEVFVDGWLNTRDMGRIDEDGYLYVEGRSDDMIITGGENVHPGEIEDVIAALPDVAEVAVFGAPDERWGQRVCAAIVSRDSGLTAEKVVAQCQRRLAGYKVPHTIVFLDRLPKTATGKITRLGLVDLVTEPVPDDHRTGKA